MNVRATSLFGLFGVAAFAALLGTGCGEAQFTEVTPTPDGPGTGNTFEGVMNTVVTEDCAQQACHSAQAAASGLNLGGPGADPCAVYDAILAGGVQSQADANANGGFPYNSGTVHPTNAQLSFILRKPLAPPDPYGDVTHGGGKQFPTDTDDNYEAVLLWLTGPDGVYPGGGDDVLLPAGCSGGSKGCGCAIEPARASSVVSMAGIGFLALVLYRRRR